MTRVFLVVPFIIPLFGCGSRDSHHSTQIGETVSSIAEDTIIKHEQNKMLFAIRPVQATLLVSLICISSASPITIAPVALEYDRHVIKNLNEDLPRDVFTPDYGVLWLFSQKKESGSPK
jgi:hypothetical protein